MPCRQDIQTVLVIGSGPIVIGQAAEFDYSGTQACRVLREEGKRVVLVNSNPATIMTDPGFADATYIEPITPEVLEAIIAKERPEAVLATLGGQTALNAAIDLHDRGVLERYGVELIGASVDAIRRGEDRQLFKDVALAAGADVARSTIARSVEDAVAFAGEYGYPVVVRPSFTMGGLGSGFAHDEAELTRMVADGIHASPASEVLLEESILGWKEIELELMRDGSGTTVVVCTIENFDPVGVHTGDSIAVAPAMTLTHPEVANLAEIGKRIIADVGVETGGCNIQFAIDPATGRVIVIEMNPRVSRSSALASKATGFPIAKIAAKVALGYRLDEIQNDLTGTTLAAFEPSVDYIVVKAPRFNFEKFPAADATLTTTMKSVGEAMAIARTFPQALQKALRSLEQRGSGFHWGGEPGDVAALLEQVRTPTDGRAVTVQQALRAGATVEQVFAATGIDPWFLDQIVLMNDEADRIRQADDLTAEVLRAAKELGFSDAQIAALRGLTEEQVRQTRWDGGVRPVFKRVDTVAGAFPARVPYLYSSYDAECEAEPTEREKVIILGSGPNRIGQGVEFDYSCVHASFALRDAGYETVMVNCNPETVSTDYTTSDRLFFEPLTLEDVLEIVEVERRAGTLAGVIVQLGGQTPLGLARALENAGVPILGTTPDAIDLAEERGAFQRILDEQGLLAPANGTATSEAEAARIAREIGYPVLVRPSFVLGGRGMEIIGDEAGLKDYFARIGGAGIIAEDKPLLVDHFLPNAVEIDVDAVFDGEELYVGGILEHVEEAGIHSGDSSCTLPPYGLGRAQLARVREATEAIARGLGVRGPINMQFAMVADTLYVIEANPRASRTVPFVAKAQGLALAKANALVLAGRTIAELIDEGLLPERDGTEVAAGAPVAVKEVVLPFRRFRTHDGRLVDTLLGPEMRSTGEVMGIDTDLPRAFAKAQAAAGSALPRGGTVFVSLADDAKRAAVMPVHRLAQLGFDIAATRGTAETLRRAGIPVTEVAKLSEVGFDASIVGAVHRGEVAMLVNTPSTGESRGDGYEIRAAASGAGIPVFTTVSQLAQAVMALETLAAPVTVTSLQEYDARR